MPRDRRDFHYSVWFPSRRITMEPSLSAADRPPILMHKSPGAESLFVPSALLREARRQKGLPTVAVPPCCILDPDGDIVRRLHRTHRATPLCEWPCYHTELDTFDLAGQRVGIVGRAVGAPFAVLIAEELFATGCRLLISITSAGQITNICPPPYFVIIDRALRDEGTSYHYMEASNFADADAALVELASDALKASECPAHVGASWTTDAPFRETAEAIEAARRIGIFAVEMEAAALYAFARAKGAAVLCLAHVTNSMGQHGADFEKGADDGTSDALDVLRALSKLINRMEDRE